MNKAELISYMADNSNGELTKVLASTAIDLVFEGIEAALGSGEKVQIVGHLTVEPVAKAARKGYNAIEDKEIIIPPTVGLRMYAGKNWKDAVKNLRVTDFIKDKK